MNKKIIKRIVAGALALTLSASILSTTAFARPGDPEPDYRPLAIKKVLNIPAEGVKTPEATFEFELKPYSKDSDIQKIDEVPKADITETVSYSAGDVNDEDDQTPGKQIIKSLKFDLNKIAFKNAGQYTYELIEKAPSPAIDGMIYSKAKYWVSIFVREGGNGELSISDIQVAKKSDDDGLPTGDAKAEYDGHTKTLDFNNKYEKEDKGLELQKNVVGDNTTETKFPFSITVDKPEGSKKTTFKYTVAGGSESEGKYGEKIDVELKNGEKIVLNKVLLGSIVKAEETDSKGYIGSVDTEKSKMNGQAVTDEKLKDGMVIGNEGDNSVIYNNTKQTPTGVVINNLPFIALALIAGVGIFFFVKNGRKNETFEA